MLHIKLRQWSIENLAITYSVLSLGRGQKVKIFFFLNEVMLHAKLKGMEHSSYSVLTHTHPQPVGRVIKGKKI